MTNDERRSYIVRINRCTTALLLRNAPITISFDQVQTEYRNCNALLPCLLATLKKIQQLANINVKLQHFV